jgi:ribonuclease P protein component
VKRRFRLTRSTDIKRVRSVGKSYAHPLVVLVAAPSTEAGTRVAVSAGKRVGGAVQRNRAKRLIREAIRLLYADLQPGWDIMLIARAPVIAVSMNAVYQALSVLVRRAGLLHES